MCKLQSGNCSVCLCRSPLPPSLQLRGTYNSSDGSACTDNCFWMSHKFSLCCCDKGNNYFNNSKSDLVVTLSHLRLLGQKATGHSTTLLFTMVNQGHHHHTMSLASIYLLNFPVYNITHTQLSPHTFLSCRMSCHSLHWVSWGAGTCRIPCHPHIDCLPSAP